MHIFNNKYVMRCHTISTPMKSKKIIWFILLIKLMVNITAHAQRIGIRGGVSFGRQKQNTEFSRTPGNVNSVVPFIEPFEEFETQAVTQFHVGLTAEVKLSERWVLQPALLYARKGGAATGVASFPDQDIIRQPWYQTNRLSYVTLPVVVAYKIPLGPGHLAVGAGPYAGVLLKGHSRATGSIRIYGFQELEPLSIGRNNIVMRFDAGLSTQARYEFAKRLFVLATYELGVLNVMGNAVIRSDEDYIRNRSLELGAGVYVK